MSQHRKGLIVRLYVNPAGCNIELDTYQTDPHTYFKVRLNHENYTAVYSLALAAAINRYKVWLRLRDGTDDEVLYIVVDW